MEERRYSSWLLERLASGDAFRLRLGSSSIGRQHSSVVRILDSTYVSRNHAVIYVSDDDQKVQITDLKSVNGIFVNAQCHRGATIDLSPGDQVGIGVDVKDDEASPEDPVFVLKHLPLRRPCIRKPADPLEPKAVATKPAEDTESPISTISNNNKCSERPSDANREAEIILISDDEDDADIKKEQSILNVKKQPIIVSDVMIEKPFKIELPTCSKYETTLGDTKATPAEGIKNPLRNTKDEPTRCCNLPNNKNIASMNSNISDNNKNISNLSAKFGAAAKVPLDENTKSLQNNQSSDLAKNTDISIPTADMNIINKSIACMLEIEKDNVIEKNNAKGETVSKVKETSATKSDQSIQSTSIAHMPIISNVKQEHLRTVTAHIKDIFGEADEILGDTIKDINPLIYKEIGGVKTLACGDCISILSDDDECEKMGEIISITHDKGSPHNVDIIDKSVKTKSPNIFESSLNTSNEEDQHKLSTKEDVPLQTKVPLQKCNTPENEDYAYQPRSDDEDVEDLMFSQVIISDVKTDKKKLNEKKSNRLLSLDNPNLREEGDCNIPLNEDDEIMYSQVVINDMKEEMANENIDDIVENLDQVVDQIEFSNSELASLNLEKNVDNEITIKKEHDSTCWITSDEEDEELESKVSDWSAKLFSQRLTQGNMSQVYEIENDSDDDIEHNSARTMLNDDGNDLNSYIMLDNEDNEDNDLYVSYKEMDTNKNFAETAQNDAITKTQTDENTKNNAASNATSSLKECNNLFLDELFNSLKQKYNVKDAAEEKSDASCPPSKELSPILKKKHNKTKKILCSSDEEVASQDKKSHLGRSTTTDSLLDSPVVRKHLTKVKRVFTSSEEDDEVAATDNKVVYSCKSERKNSKVEKPQRRKSLSILRDDKIKTGDQVRPLKELSPPRRKSLSKEVSKDESHKKTGPEITKECRIVIEPIKVSKENPVYSVLPEKRGPAIIDAPKLPKHKGKLRGVSASLPSTKERLAKIHENIRCENYTNDLKRKWLEKPSLTKKREKERAKVIKESRKERLKEIADKQQKDAQNIPQKRKSRDDDSDQLSKKPKVKITTVNRGAFLAEETATVPPKPYRIPKIALTTAAAISGESPIELNNANINSTLKMPTSSTCSISKTENVRRVSSDTFAQQLNMPDILLLKRQNSSDNSSTDSDRRSKKTKATKEHTSSLNEQTSSASVHKESAAVRLKRMNKLTFESMQRNFVQSHKNQKKLETISNVRSISSNTEKSIDPLVKPTESTMNVSDVSLNSKVTPANLETADMKPSEEQEKLIETRGESAEPAVKRQKKTVRFNETPIVYYIERISGATKKVDKKDLMPATTITDRRHIIRQKYPLIDCTDKIISMILKWSNGWLVKRNAELLAARNVVLPMPNQFTSYENYKSILFPLMELEFLSVLEREYNTRKFKPFKVTLENVTTLEDRMMLITKYNSRSEPARCDLVILDFNDKHSGTFAYNSAYRKGTGFSSTCVFEIIGKNFTKDYLNCIKEIDVRPVVDNIRVEFGALNAVFQLESTPLYEKILKPLELLNSKCTTNMKFKYKGFDKLNVKQENILLNAYAKILDETTPNITLIKGPPGTGKSCVITNLALQTLYGDEVRWMDKKILICAQSNGAVDVIAGKLFDIQQRMRPNIMFRVIRYGILDKVHRSVVPIMLQKIVERDQMRKLAVRNSVVEEGNKENLKNEILKLEAKIIEMQSRNIKGTVEEDELIEHKKQLQMMRNIVNQFMRPEDERSIYTWYLTNAHIVCTTLSSCVKLSQYVNYFDVCIIDEATQCTEPWTLLPLKFGINSLILVGDAQQLPATVLSKKAMQLGLGNSMFTRIQKCLENVNVSTESSVSNVICSLQTQYRMHPEICKWPNFYFYKNELINAPNTKLLDTPLAPFSILNLEYSQNQHCIDGKISNSMEAEFVVNLLKALDGYIPSKYNSYGVITPYAEHRTKLEATIKSCGISNIMVNTIDSYQGVEKDVIVISNARTSGIGFLANYQRLNVALTRPRKCLILCGNFKNLESVPSWRSLLSNARERNVFHEVSATKALDIHRNVIPKIKI